MLKMTQSFAEVWNFYRDMVEKKPIHQSKDSSEIY